MDVEICEFFKVYLVVFFMVSVEVVVDWICGGNWLFFVGEDLIECWKRIYEEWCLWYMEVVLMIFDILWWLMQWIVDEIVVWKREQ